jgi:hypothetical protein
MNHRHVVLVAGLAVALGAAAGWAQEPDDASVPAGQDAVRQGSRPQIRVLSNPYDLASFYRSGGPEAGDAFDFSDRYPIASFYRAGGGVHSQGYSRFWTSGYGGRGAFGSGYRSRIGENGDLFLLAPTFLAPLGPLTAAFADR